MSETIDLPNRIPPHAVVNPVMAFRTRPAQRDPAPRPARRMPRSLPDGFSQLLAAPLPGHDGSCTVLHPLWAEEAMHRARSFARLAGACSRRHGTGRNGRPFDRADGTLAADLAQTYAALATEPDRRVVACSRTLRDAVTSLCSVFGGAADITLRTNIERLALPAYKRRALVLAASELAVNAMLHAYPTRQAGQMVVSLTAFGPAHACLHVADDGAGFIARRPDLCAGIAAALAGVLEAELTYKRTATWTLAEIMFPVRA